MVGMVRVYAHVQKEALPDMRVATMVQTHGPDGGESVQRTWDGLREKIRAR